MTKLNCMIVDDDAVMRQVIKRYVEQTDFLCLVKECSDARCAAEYLAEHTIDLIFLDVEMPEMTGLEFLGVLNNKPLFVMMSSKRAYAVDAFDQEATDFMLKPVLYERFLRAAKRALAQFELERQSNGKADKQQNHIFFKVDACWVKLSIQNIVYVQAMSDYVGIYAFNDAAQLKRYVIHSTMKSVADKLDAANFVRVHRSFIVNTFQISAFQNDQITIVGKEIPVGVTYKDAVENALLKILSNG